MLEAGQFVVEGSCGVFVIFVCLAHIPGSRKALKASSSSEEVKKCRLKQTRTEKTEQWATCIIRAHSHRKTYTSMKKVQSLSILPKIYYVLKTLVP